MTQFLWRFFQLGIVGVVVWLNAEYHFTPNSLIPGLAGVVLAIFLTHILSGVIDGAGRLWHWLRPRVAASK